MPAKRKPKTAEDAKLIVGTLNPAEIVNQEAYDKYIKISKQSILNDGKFIVTSANKKISLGTLDHNLKNLIEHLPEQEQSAIMAKRRLYNKLLCERNTQLRLAYGTVVKDDATHTKSGYNKQPATLDQRSAEIIELFGRMFTTQEVHEICINEWKIPVSIKTVGDFRITHQKEIERRVEDHKRTYSDIRLGHKRSRLEELSYLFLTRKRIYEATKKSDDHRLLLMTLEQVRKEAEGDSIRIDGTMNFNIEQTIQEHIQKELFVHFPLKEIIMARVAARAGKSVGQLLNEFDKSYYNKFLHNTQDIEHEEVPAFPSTLPYDFDRIRREQAQLAAAPKQEVKVMDIETTDAATKIQQMLLAKLQTKKEDVNAVKNNLSGRFIDKANGA